MTLTLQRKVVFITGGNRNIGRATALCLASKGTDVVITQSEQEDTAAQTVKDLIAPGVSAAAIQVDLAGTAQLPAFVKQFKQHLADWARATLTFWSTTRARCTSPPLTG